MGELSCKFDYHFSFILLTICGAVTGHVNTIKLETIAHIKPPIINQFSLICNQRISPILRINIPEQRANKRIEAHPLLVAQSQNAVNGIAKAILIPNKMRNDFKKL
jgi:hypothetical protein